MTEPTLDTLTQRLDRLERENRRWRQCAAVVGLCALGLALAGQARPTPVAKVISAERFSLMDASGRIRASLYTKNERGSPVLTFSDDAGTRRIVLGLTDGGSLGLDIFDQQGRGGIVLGVGSNGNSNFFATDRLGKTRVVLGVTTEGTPGLELSNKDGRVIWKAP
jgi:hypothetical protein